MNYMELLAQTRVMLDNCRGSWPELARRSGVSHPWLSKFMRGKIPNPGIHTLDAVDGTLRQMQHEPPAKSDGPKN